MSFYTPDLQNAIAFDSPKLVFTVNGLGVKNPKAVEVLESFRQLLKDTHREQLCTVRVFDSSTEVSAVLTNGTSPKQALVLFDVNVGEKEFSMTTTSRSGNPIPGWAHSAQWGVGVSPNCRNVARCSRQFASDFFFKFHTRLNAGHFPWGYPRAGEKVPRNVELPTAIFEVIDRLNSGPDFKDAMADDVYAAELALDSKISWSRVVLSPFEYKGAIKPILAALEDFEVACSSLVSTGNAQVLEMLSAGVDLPEHEQDLLHFYLYPPTNRFSVRRPDLHHTGTRLFASENDEMPGGFAELFHLDSVYKLNAFRWKSCFEFLTNRGLLLFVVSSKWSRCYLPELRWLKDHMASLGYPVQLVTSDHMDEIAVNSSGVFYGSEPVGTIWRQFPIFETEGKLAEMVRAASSGLVRVVPEFGHWGNKAWFSVFRKFPEYFRKTLGDDSFRILDSVLPNSHLVMPGDLNDSFPFSIESTHVPNLSGLINLPANLRNGLVLKVSGANTFSARSYGVLMGKNLTDAVWTDWISQRIQLRQPFIVQHRLPTGVMQIPVYNTVRRCSEMVSVRMLMRPWTIDGQLVSINGCAVPSDTERVHGRSDMAVVPFLLD